MSLGEEIDSEKDGEVVQHARHPDLDARAGHPVVAAPLDLDPADSLHDRVRQIIDLIRPAVQSDGGDLELVEVSPEGVVRVRFHGACVGCPSSTMTLQTGIERSLRERVDGITRVEAVE